MIWEQNYYRYLGIFSAKATARNQRLFHSMLSLSQAYLDNNSIICDRQCRMHCFCNSLSMFFETQEPHSISAFDYSDRNWVSNLLFLADSFKISVPGRQSRQRKYTEVAILILFSYHKCQDSWASSERGSASMHRRRPLGADSTG